jgi:putative transposase
MNNELYALKVIRNRSQRLYVRNLNETPAQSLEPPFQGEGSAGSLSHHVFFAFFIELENPYPVRAGMVDHPVDYPWSNYRAYAQGAEDKLLQSHELYLKLENNAAARQRAYSELFRYELEPGLVDEIRRATNGNYALGNTLFAEQVAKVLK